ncbi:MMPL family transporter [Myxococcota bacterium]|nr:MMPL family transporter [Myxococcota bacterium]
MKPPLLSRLHRGAARRPWGVLSALGALLLCCLLLAPGLVVDQDMLRLMPGGPRRDELRTLVDDFTLLSQVVLHIEASEPDEDGLIAASDAAAARLRASGGFRRVEAGLDPDEKFKTWDAVFPHRFQLAPQEVTAAALSDAGLARAMSRVRDTMASPASAFFEEALLRDPLELTEAALRAALARGNVFDVDLVRDHLLSRDRRHALVLAVPEEAGLGLGAAVDVAAAAREAAAAAREAAPGIRAEALGAPVYADESARAIKKDVWASVPVSIAAILGLLVLVLRGPRGAGGMGTGLRAAVLVFVPAAGGALVALGTLAAATGTIHGVSLAFGAALVGVSVDYGVHLVVHTRRRRAMGGPDLAVASAVGETSRSLVTGLLTTLAAFGILLLSPSTGMRELGLFAVAGVFGAFVLAVVAVPLLYPRWVDRVAAPREFPEPLGDPIARAAGLAARHRRVTLALFAAFGLGSAVAASGVDFDGDIRNLDSRSEALQQAEKRLQDAFGAAGTAGVVIAAGEDVDAALARNDLVHDILAREGPAAEVTAVASLSGILPSAGRQASRVAAALAAAGPDPGARLAAAATGAGLVPGAFAPFLADLDALRAGAAPPLRPGDLAGTALQSLVEARISEKEGSAKVLTLVDLPPRMDDLGAFPPALEASLRQVPGTVVFSWAGLANEVIAQVRHDLARLLAVGLAGVAALLLMTYRRPGPALRALLPSALALVAVAAWLSMRGIGFNLANACSVVLILGMGVDYGIFVVDALARGDVEEELRGTGSSVAISALTTVLGFGSMATSSNGAVASLGEAIIVGLTTAAAASLLLLPALEPRRAARGAGERAA